MPCRAAPTGHFLPLRPASFPLHPAQARRAHPAAVGYRIKSRDVLEQHRRRGVDGGDATRVHAVVHRHLGVEGYGLIGFYITLQALLQIVDLGFAPTINRWLSRYSAGHEEPQYARDLAKTLEIASWCIATAAGAMLIAGAGLVARLCSATRISMTPRFATRSC